VTKVTSHNMVLFLATAIWTPHLAVDHLDVCNGKGEVRPITGSEDPERE
jgi:hypothetical protein